MPNFALRLTLLALALNLLTACETASSNPACVCPPIKEYSREHQEKLATEVKTIPEGSLIIEALRDYAMLRSVLMACFVR